MADKYTKFLTYNYPEDPNDPDNDTVVEETYLIKENPKIHYAVCSTAAATAAKTIDLEGFVLDTGSWIAVKFTITNTAAVANLTLNVNGTGAKNIKYRNANLGSAGYLAANRIYLMLYDGTYWQIVGDINTNDNTYDRTMMSTRIYAGGVGVFPYSLCALDINQRVQAFTTTGGTGTSKVFNTTAKFLYPPTIMYHYANETKADGAVVTNNVLYEQFPSANLTYSCNITTSAGFTQYKPVYLEAVMNADGTWSPTTTGLTQTFTSGKYYILLGCMYDTSIYQLCTFAHKPMFYYNGTNLVGCPAGSAIKLQTARTISLGTGVTATATSFDGTSNITIPVTGIYEAYLKWGGKDFSADYGPLDAALVGRLGANRFELPLAAGITVERTTDDGTTWTVVSLSDAQKRGLFSTPGSTVNVAASSTAGMGTDAAKYKMRATLRTSAAAIYTYLNKFIIYMSTSGCSNCYVQIRIRLESDRAAGTDKWKIWNKTNKSWVLTTDASATDANTRCPLSGWSGFNVINITGFTAYGNASAASSQYGEIQFIFGCVSNTSTYGGMGITSIMGFGGVGWTCPTNLSRTGHLYSYDANQNATFPAAITATNFAGKLNGFTVSGTTDSTYNLNDMPKVKQSASTTDDFRPIVLGYKNATDPSTLSETVTDQVYTTTRAFIQPSTGNLTLWSSTGDSPALVLRRGTYTDNLNDWKMYAKGGGLYFAQSTANASTETWTDKMYFHPSNGKLYVGSTAVSLEGHTHNYAGSSSAGGAATNINTTVTPGTSPSHTSYGLVFVQNPDTSGSNAALKSDDVRVLQLDGTASDPGYARIVLGNTTAEGTAGNKNGEIALYSGSGGAHIIDTSDISATTTHTLPSTGGTILNTGTTSFTQTLSSGTKIGTIKINGTSTDLYCQTNTNTDTKVNVTLATTTKAYLLGTSTTPTSTAQAVESVADTGVYLGTTAGSLCVTGVVSANVGNSGNAGGLSLYSTDPETYGIMFRNTSNSGTHGYVQSDWATYFTMNQGGTTRGWVFRKKTDGPVASISGAGHAVFNGSVTVGGNASNTSGCRMEYNTTTQSLDFVFV